MIHIVCAKSFIDPGLNWSDMKFFKNITNSKFRELCSPWTASIPCELVPLILKGVQSWEDALEAYDMGLSGVVLSNHGGRQLDFARSGIEVLVEVVDKLKKKRGLSFPNEKFQLFIDGGVRRATDVIKAVALGATAGMMALSTTFFFGLPDATVGIGRPFLYAFSSYGQEGVEKALRILHVWLLHTLPWFCY